MNRFIITFGAAAACLLGGVQSALAKETVDPAKQAALRANIVKFAQSKMGTKVGERGECTDLVDAALKQCGGKPAFNSQTSVTEDGKVSIVPTYGWGTHVYYAIRNVKTAVAGSIIQFEKCTIKTGNVTSNVPHHTAIVESVNGSKVTVLHQNSNGNRTVQRKTYDFAGLQSGGSLRVYLPIPK